MRWICDGDWVFVTRTPKRAFWPALHTRLAQKSGLKVFPDSPSVISPVTGCNYGFVSTSLTILESISASKSLKLLCRIVTKPPFLQLRVCVTLYFSPQGQIAGKPLRGLPYLKLRASLNSLLFRVKPNSSKGNHGSSRSPLPPPPNLRWGPKNFRPKWLGGTSAKK